MFCVDTQNANLHTDKLIGAETKKKVSLFHIITYQENLSKVRKTFFLRDLPYETERYTILD